VNLWGQQVIVVAAFVLVALRAGAGGGERAAWIALAVALGVWGAGNSIWTVAHYDDPNAPFPSWADAGWLAFYPFAYVCLVLRVKTAAGNIPAAVWLDGLVGVLAVAAVGAAVIVAPMLSGSEGHDRRAGRQRRLPIGDLLLVSMVGASVGLSGAGRGRSWLLLGVGFFVFAFADTLYLYELTNATYEHGGVLGSMRGMVPPDEFIPLAEQTGVIASLTDLVVSHALRQAAAWRAGGMDLTMAVTSPPPACWRRAGPTACSPRSSATASAPTASCSRSPRTSC